MTYITRMNKPDNKLIGNRIRSARISLNLTQAELAEYLGGMTQAAIQKMESGKQNMTLENIFKLSWILKRSIPYLLGVDTPGQSDDETELLELFRSLPDGLPREYLLISARAWARQFQDNHLDTNE